jgi:hypothetical protein
MLIMSIGRDYISELQPPTGLLFIPQVIYEHGETWWNDIDRGKILIRQPEFSGSPTSSHLVANQEELGKGNGELVVSLFILESDFFTYR